MVISDKVCSQVQETAFTDSSTGFIIEGNWGGEQQINILFTNNWEFNVKELNNTKYTKGSQQCRLKQQIPISHLVVILI